METKRCISDRRNAGVMLQARVLIHGIVQGVGFRHSLWRKAREKNLSGWVCNNPDGSVEALFQGDHDSIRSVVDWCRNGPIFARVGRVDVFWEEMKESFESFEICF